MAIDRASGPALAHMALGRGYASAFAPWMVLVTALAKGLLPGQGEPIAGPAQLPFAIAWLLATGSFSALIGLFSGLLFVSPEGNAFCALASRCAGVAGCAGAALFLAACSHAAPRPSPKDLMGIALTFGAIACLFVANRAARRNATPTVKKQLAATETP